MVAEICVDVAGKTILVTGAAKRIGKEIAFELARKGANVAVHYLHSEKEALETVSQIKKLGVNSVALKADLSKWLEAQKMVFVAREEMGALDALVNNASLFFPTPLEDVSEEQFDQMLNSNLKGAFACSLEAAKIMKSNPTGGKIVSIADWSAKKPYRDYAPYQVAKAGVLAMTSVLAKELAPKILVNAVAPGPMLPPENMTKAEADAIAKTTLLGKWGGPHAIAQAVAFLLENDFMTGQTIFVDGGRMLK